ncbi:hypothetical protein EAG18_08170 [Pseudoalteromonas sp. J010]|uniref:phage baseplate assembly protein V n=1 Tax=Pseudoalteromonas sp. J010 TaxID=998465 RepID=UPI000F655EFC|nr:phage baseplate assembly protein V [Pseudoalteromonas sp. J010]RRS09085.1 hypothetical protein EAG18_08170 [Pseudoalteromonas sp. J010]
MGLIKQSDWLRPRNALQRQYEGTVVDVKDPRMLGRVKVSIEGLIDSKFIDIDDLPWCYPQLPAHLGNNAFGSSMYVPELHSTVLVEFPEKSIYHPVYRWRVSNRQTRPTDFQSEYPHRYGEADAHGNKSITSHAPGLSFKESRQQDGSQTFNDNERSVTLLSDPHGTLVEFDRENQKLYASFAGVELTITKSGIFLNTPSLMINSADAISLLASNGVDVATAQNGIGFENIINQIIGQGNPKGDKS